MKKLAIFQLKLSTRHIGRQSFWTLIYKRRAKRGCYNLIRWMSLETMHMRTQEFTRRRQSYGMTSSYQGVSLWMVNKFFYITLVFDYFPTSYVQDDRYHSWLHKSFHIERWKFSMRSTNLSRSTGKDWSHTWGEISTCRDLFQTRQHWMILRESLTKDYNWKHFLGGNLSF